MSTNFATFGVRSFSESVVKGVEEKFRTDKEERKEKKRLKREEKKGVEGYVDDAWVKATC